MNPSSAGESSFPCKSNSIRCEDVFQPNQALIDAITSRGISIAQRKRDKYDDDDDGDGDGDKKRPSGILDLVKKI